MIMELHLADLHSALGDPALNSMNFLNEVAQDYPDAVSLAAGRPYEEFFEFSALHRYLDIFRQHLVDDLGQDSGQVRRTLFQYGRTKGIVHHLVARNLAVDEGMTVDPEAIVVTVGCQEAMFLVLRALRTGPRDVLLAAAPTYVGPHRRGAAAGLSGSPGSDDGLRGGPGGPTRSGGPGPGRRAASTRLLSDA